MADEALKWPFIEQHPEIKDAIHELEDNSLIRGRIMAFELDAAKLAARAKAFTDSQSSRTARPARSCTAHEG